MADSPMGQTSIARVIERRAMHGTESCGDQSILGEAFLEGDFDVVAHPLHTRSDLPVVCGLAPGLLVHPPRHGRRPVSRARRLRGAGAVALALLAIIGAPAAASASFTAPASLSEAGRSATRSQVAVGPDGAATIVWHRSNFSNDIVQAATRPAGSVTFGAPANLSVAGQDARDPQVAIGPDGTTTVAWRRFNGLNYIIQAATRPAGSATFGTPTSLSAAFANALDPQIAIGADGTTTIAWSRFNGSNFVIQAATRAAGSSTFLGSVNVSDAGQDAFGPQVAVGPDGASTVTWYRYNGSNDIVQAATRPALGGYTAPVDLSAAGQDAAAPQVAVGPDGATTITWYRSNGSKQIIQAATRPAGESDFGPPTDVSTAGQSALDPHVAVGGDGRTTIAWYRFNGFTFVAQAATRDAGSAVFAAPVNLSDVGQEAFDARVASGADGATTITWSRSNGSHSIAQATTRPAGSATFGAPINLSEAGRDALFPEVSAGADGATTVTWTRDNGSNFIAQASSRATSLNLTNAGPGAGTVTSAPAGIDCGTACSALFPLGLRVTLAATAGPGSVFAGWSGGGCDAGATTCVVTISAPVSVEASFSGGSADPGAPATPVVPVAPAWLRLTRIKTSPRAITTSFRVSGAGALRQVGTRPSSTRTRAPEKARVITVCSARRSATAAGMVTLTCRLGEKTRAARSRQSLRVRLVTEFVATDGTTKEVSRTIVLKR